MPLTHLIATRLGKKLTDVRKNGQLWWVRPDGKPPDAKKAKEVAPSMEEMNQLIKSDVIEATLKEITLKNGKPAISLYGDHTNLHINPSGKFIIGGPQGDAGLTGRKIIIDTYGG